MLRERVDRGERKRKAGVLILFLAVKKDSDIHRVGYKFVIIFYAISGIFQPIAIPLHPASIKIRKLSLFFSVVVSGIIMADDIN